MISASFQTEQRGRVPARRRHPVHLRARGPADGHVQIQVQAHETGERQRVTVAGRREGYFGSGDDEILQVRMCKDLKHLIYYRFNTGAVG